MLKLDLRLLRLPQDPADWLLRHPTEEFAALLSQAVPVLEYSIRRIADEVRGSDAMKRSRAVPKIKELIRKIDDSVLYNEALRLAAEALGVGLEVLDEQRTSSTRPTSHAISRSDALPSTSEPLIEAGREVLALMLARPDLAARPLREGMKAQVIVEPVAIEEGDFGDEAHARIFALLTEHAGEDLEAVLSDERARPLLDEISALRASEEKVYPSEVSLRAAWFRLAALSRERAKLLTDDFDEKYRLHAEFKRLNKAAVEASNLILES
jgi:DNA primase